MNFPTATLLIVEDFQASRELYRNCLMTDDKYTYEFLEAESMTAGLELFHTRSIDAILLDYKLPDGDGLEFLEILSARSNGSSPPVVMMTGHGDESIAVCAMKLGAQNYLAKHKFTPERLASTMHSSILQGRDYANDNACLRRQLQQSQDLLQLSIDTMLDCFGIYAAIVKKIVEAQGGTIWLESQIGHGTTFYFTWLKRSSPAEPPAALTVLPDGVNLTA
jgi:DNA-binding NtrC family response regulator